ncbi:glycosyl transferase [Microbulbifer agarilyticus]|uniref:Glycosyl transferase n=1 Tax=Microbulbifer agarilyticus TaxID=260552 RepID=A0A1Q2M5F3_9GAMM|nr:glycosyltransferase family 4 protein [Microbulbifer agarilyticus]AQQ67517.1 glycosyl transferase [Microbulbifer agarilyticus]
MTIWWLLAVVVGVSFFATGALRRYALSRSLMDIPNSRSSHSVATPRGGGVAIVFVFSGVLPLLACIDVLSWGNTWALLGAGLMVAIIGFWDDHGHVPARWRLLGHFVAAFWALFLIGGMPPLYMFGVEFKLAWLGQILGAIYLVWLLNLYNFMDGIDGIASVEAICVCVGGALLYWVVGSPNSDYSLSWLVPVVLAAAVVGFFFWNCPPAKIFMGDAGSGFLGISLGVLSLQVAWVAPQLFWSWLILLGVFVVDATWTLIFRFFRGDKVYEAHRSHAYQHAARIFGKHSTVTYSVVVINVFWLFPIAYMVGLKSLDGLLGLILAYLPLAFFAVKFNAGSREADSSC